MLVHRERLLVPRVFLQVIQRTLREPHLLPLGIRNRKYLLPHLVGVLPVNYPRRARQVKLHRRPCNCPENQNVRGYLVHQITAFTAGFGIRGEVRAITRNYHSPQPGWCTAAGRIADENTPDAYIAAPAPPGGRRYVR